jgi:membrane-associated PAP2 superfamily phosphatase
MLKKWFPATFWYGLGILLVLSLPFIFTDLDLIISGWFYQQGWIYGEAPLWFALYRYGTLPGLLLGVGGLIIFSGSWIRPAWQPQRRAAAVVLLTLLLGPGLLVNVLGKGYMGRPRPRDVSTLGGTETFLRLGTPGTPGRGKSFPSGHPSVGYLICVLFFLDPHSRRRWVWLGTGLGYGTLMGAARVIQGAHFTSDVLWSGGLTYLSAVWANQVTPESFNFHALRKWFPQNSHFKKAFIIFGSSVLLVGLTFFFLLATPFYKSWNGQISGEIPRQIRFQVPRDYTVIRLNHRSQPVPVMAQAEFQGFGFPKLSLHGDWRTHSTNSVMIAELKLQLNGWVTEKKGYLTITVPLGVDVFWEDAVLNSQTVILEDGRRLQPPSSQPEKP